MKKWLVPALLVLLCALPCLALSEAAITANKALYLCGERVDMTVTADKDIKTVKYTVLRDGDTLYQQKKADTHTAVSYLPQIPGEYRVEAAIVYKDKQKETVSVSFTVSQERALPPVEGLYSQKDGSWADKEYGRSTLQVAGCAIFTLSNALHLLGVTGPETEPAALAAQYGYCLIQGGTSNVRLITQAGKDFDFLTQSALVKEPAAIADLLGDGAVFTFSIVRGHIALACEVNEDKTKVRVVDSAPSATLERIKNGSLYRKDESGAYVKVKDLSEMDGAVYYLETQHYGGLSYWLDMSYVAKRGVRIIQPYWLKTEGGASAELSVLGTVQSAVVIGGETRLVPTGSLSWHRETEAPQAVFVTSKKPLSVTDSSGKQIARVARGTLLPVISATEETISVRCQNRVGYLPAAEGQVLDIPPEGAQQAVLHVNGTKTGKSNVAVRRSALSNSTQITHWPTGVTVVVHDAAEGFYLCEYNGMVGWVSDKNIEDFQPLGAGE